MKRKNLKVNSEYYLEWCPESAAELKVDSFQKWIVFNAVSSCAGSPSVSPDVEPIKIKPAAHT